MKMSIAGILLIIIFITNVCAKEIVKKSNWTTAEGFVDSLLQKVELIPIMVNGDKNNRINIVLMNRWTSRESAPYNSPKMRDEFIRDINESIIAALTPGDKRAQTAYANYRDFFNVYGLWYPDTPEWDKGIDGKVVDALRDKLFLPWKDENTGWVTFLVLPNSTSGGGGAARNLEDRVGTALIAGNGIGKMLHEIAHTCMSIGDEYTGSATGNTAIPTYNSSMDYERDIIKWRKWIDPDTPLPTPYTATYKDKIGAFEGTQYHLTGYYRSSAQGCIMGAGIFDNTEKMCPICEQRVAMRVYKLVNPLKSSSPSDKSITINGQTGLHFEIDHIRPVPNTQVVRWALNGKIIATGTDQVDVELGELAQYKLSCTLTDETPFIRPDPPYAKYPVFETIWNITNTSPTSKAGELVVSLSAGKAGVKLSGQNTITASVSGGNPPYTYLWSTGSTSKNLENVEPGIYDLVVTDSEFRKANSHLALLESSLALENSSGELKRTKSSSKLLDLEINVTASEKDRSNGKLIVAANGGSEPYTYEWIDAKTEYGEGRVYEAENAQIEIPGCISTEYFEASNKSYLNFNSKEGSVIWTVEVAKSGNYPVDIIFGGVSMNGTGMNIWINGNAVKNPVFFCQTRPLFTGWETATVWASLQAGKNTVRLSSTGNSGPTIDYLRIPSSFKISPLKGNERINLTPGNYTVVITDHKGNSLKKTIHVPEVYPFEINKLKIESNGSDKLLIANPLPAYSYQWYSNAAPLFTPEKYEYPLFTGNEFTPPAPGNYCISAKDERTHAESSNRICFAVGKAPAIQSVELNPSVLGEESIKLWFDASDLDGDGNIDGIFPQRGPVLEWKEKTWRNPGKIFAKYEPNKLNGMGVCTFDNVWISRLSKKISDVKTIVMVYRESTMTLAGKAPFVELNNYLGKSSDTAQRLFDMETTDAKTINGKVYLNGLQVDPFKTANPMNFCIMTIELESAFTDQISTTEGNFEGSIAEIILIDRNLSDSERTGIEEYLRKKWFSSVDFNF